jgi:DNA-directed RNA polymerase specialized sigma24 family protein
MGDVISLRPGPDSGSWERPRASEVGEPDQDEASRLVFLVHEPALRRRALRLTRPRDAECLVRETFAIFRQQRDGAGSATSLMVWLFTVMYGLYLARSLRRLRLVGAQSAPDGHVIDPPGWAQVRRAQFVRAVAGLPPELRRVFELHAVDGLCYAEIGARLKLAPRAVFARLFRARLLLKDMLMDAVGSA